MKKKKEIEALRRIILGADRRVKEERKWNAPSFYVSEHFATFKLRPEATVQIVLHTGAKVKVRKAPLAIEDPRGLLEWVAADRALVTFADLKAITSSKAAFTKILKQWIKQTQTKGDERALPKSIGKPATRALGAAGITSLDQLAKHRRAELAALHGVGPKALTILDVEMKKLGLRWTK